jgi:hypothetical protein
VPSVATNLVHVAGRTVRWGPVVRFESRMWTVVGAVAISTQFEASALWLDLRQVRVDMRVPFRGRG